MLGHMYFNVFISLLCVLFYIAFVTFWYFSIFLYMFFYVLLYVFLYVCYMRLYVYRIDVLCVFICA